MKGRITFGRQAEIRVTDAMTFTLTDDDRPQESPALMVVFDRPSHEIAAALRQIAEQIESSARIVAKLDDYMTA